jgi:hypothetical protein
MNHQTVSESQDERKEKRERQPRIQLLCIGTFNPEFSRLQASVNHTRIRVRMSRPHDASKCRVCPDFRIPPKGHSFRKEPLSLPSPEGRIHILAIKPTPESGRVTPTSLNHQPTEVRTREKKSRDHQTNSKSQDEKERQDNFTLYLYPGYPRIKVPRGSPYLS